jgi:hypothetical protein
MILHLLHGRFKMRHHNTKPDQEVGNELVGRRNMFLLTGFVIRAQSQGL